MIVIFKFNRDVYNDFPLYVQKCCIYYKINDIMANEPFFNEKKRGKGKRKWEKWKKNRGKGGKINPFHYLTITTTAAPT